MDTLNKFMVGMRGEEIIIINPPRGPISQDDAIMLAAYLVTVAENGKIKFEEAHSALMGT